MILTFNSMVNFVTQIVGEKLLINNTTSEILHLCIFFSILSFIYLFSIFVEKLNFT